MTGIRKNKCAFSLVELIIVITIIAVLSTIGFFGYHSYLSDSRDANRLLNLTNIEKGLEVYALQRGKYPSPDNQGAIMADDIHIGFQGIFGESGVRAVGMQNIPLDPKTKSHYIYQVNTNHSAYQIMGFMENNHNFDLSIPLQHSYPFSKGKDLGILLNEENELLNGNVDLIGSGSGASYKVYLGNTIVEGTGLEIFGGLEILGKKNGILKAPYTCKDGFIPVHGNAHFLQPGFCVMKYEATHQTIDSNSDTSCTGTGNTWECNIRGDTLSSSDITSRAGVLPINYVTQAKAIELCRGLGGNTHLTTNNEWMTIARQIEKNSINWSSGEIGNGGVYRGNVIPPSSFGGINDSLSCGEDFVNFTEHTNNDSNNLTHNRPTCDEKRQLVLSNGEIIWDFSGNLWEHVNKANTIDGRLFDNGLTAFINDVSWDGDWWYPNGYNSPNMTNEIRKKYGPSQSSYGNTHGMGNIRGWGTNTSNIFVRGEGGYGGDQGGIYTLGLNWSNADSEDASFGFRCAY